MALQGTIETFALPDVMRLLGSTKKTGCLRVDGDRGSGSIWVDGGQVVAAESSGAPHAKAPVDVVFELLRFKSGDFVFDADEAASDPGAPSEVEPLLGEAEAMLEEWASIEAVVPSLESWVSLTADLPSDEVTIDRDRWKLLTTIGGGTTVDRLAGRLELGEMAIGRTVKALVEAGLAEVGEAPAGAGLDEDDVVVEIEQTLTVVETGGDDLLGDTLEDELGESFEKFDPGALVIERDDAVSSLLDEPEPLAEPAPTAASSAAYDADPGDAAEIARQLANLSPKAAKAVAAAAKATTEEERERALAEVDDEEDPINRELLIKFLGSVNG